MKTRHATTGLNEVHIFDLSAPSSRSFIRQQGIKLLLLGVFVAQSAASAQPAPQMQVPAMPLDAVHGDLAPPSITSWSREAAVASNPDRLDAPAAPAAVAKASAGNAIQLSGPANYSYDFSSGAGHLSVARVSNTSSTTTSGSLRLELWATTSPYSGGSISGYRVSTYRLRSASSSSGQLAPGEYFYDVSQDVAIEKRPPTGSYYASLIVSEYSSTCSASDGFCIDNYLPLSPQLVVPPSGSGSGSSASLQLTAPYSIKPDYVANTTNFMVSKLSNPSSTRTTGSLRLEFWATDTPYSGGSISGYRVAVASLAGVIGNSTGQLPPGYSVSDINTTTTIASVPPGGSYYGTLIVGEYTNTCGTSDGYCIATYGNFSSPFTVPTADPGTPSTSGDTGGKSGDGGGGAISWHFLALLAVALLIRVGRLIRLPIVRLQQRCDHRGFASFKLGSLAMMLALSACGGGGGSPGPSTDPGSGSAKSLDLFVGSTYSADGDAMQAGFVNPTNVAVDSRGNAYISDGGVIRKLSSDGKVTTVAGKFGESGDLNGPGTSARLGSSYGITIDASDNIYFTDIYFGEPGSHSDPYPAEFGGFFSGTAGKIRKLSATGIVSTIAGGVHSDTRRSCDGSGTSAYFAGPSGLAVDRDGNLLIANQDSNLICKTSPGGLTTTVAGNGLQGATDGPAVSAKFYRPKGVAVDASGAIYVSDEFNRTVRKIGVDNMVSTFAGLAGSYDSVDGNGSAARFKGPAGIAIDALGNLLVSDALDQTIRKITPGRDVSTYSGTSGYFGSSNGVGAQVRYESPLGVTVNNADGSAYVADTNNHLIRRISAAGVVSTAAGGVGTGYGLNLRDGSSTTANFYAPSGLAADSLGNIYVADSLNNTIRKISPAGEVLTLAGTGDYLGGEAMDGVGRSAIFNGPMGVAVDGAGNVYVADSGSHTIRKVTPAGVVTTIAGTAGTAGSVDGTGAAASFNNPQGVAVDAMGNVFVADTGNNLIRKITPGGVVSTIATGTGARSLVLDGVGNLYVAETTAHVISRITPSGIRTVIAGTPSVAGSADGSGSAASFNYPTSLAPDGAGNLLVADAGNATVRRISSSGVVSTVLGSAGEQQVVFGSRSAQPGHVQGITVTANGVYLAVDAAVLRYH